MLKQLYSVDIPVNFIRQLLFLCYCIAHYELFYLSLAVHRVINDGLGSILPSRVQRVILDGIFSIGLSQLSKTILNEKNPLGLSRLAQLKRIFEEGKSLQLQFPAEDLGFR